MADADRLQAIQDDTTRALEGRITDLMAKVHAASEINKQIAEADAQLEIGRTDLAGLDEELAGLDEDSEEHAAGSEQAEALRSAIADTEGYRDELLGALARLAGEIRG